MVVAVRTRRPMVGAPPPRPASPPAPPPFCLKGATVIVLGEGTPVVVIVRSL